MPPPYGDVKGGCVPQGDHNRKGILHDAPSSRFVFGEDNALAMVALRAVLAEPSPADGPRGYNPLVLFGPTACGKTLLVNELVAAWRERHHRLSVVCKPAVQFCQEFKEAVESQDMDQFRREHRQADLLIIEDLPRLAGKEAAQREFRETIDAVTGRRRRLVVTASSVPGQWSGVMADLQARLVAGLSVPLVYPAVESRLAIIARLSAERQIELSAEAASLLASAVDGAAVNLSGALHQLVFGVAGDGRLKRTIDGADVKVFLSKRRAPRRPELREIALETARSFSLKVAQLRGRSRARAIVTARDVAMYVARKLTQNSLQQIGHYFGGRDHTTVLHGCRKTEALLGSEPTVQRAVEQVQHKLLTTV